jgi:hypothetical protein
VIAFAALFFWEKPGAPVLRASMLTAHFRPRIITAPAA